MSCENCQDHSGHKALIDRHEKQLDSNDIDHRDMKKTIDQKVPRWIFLVVLGVLLSSFGYQVRVLEVVNSIHNNVSILGVRLENHMGGEHAGSKKQAEFVVDDSAGTSF